MSHAFKVFPSWEIRYKTQENIQHLLIQLWKACCAYHAMPGTGQTYRWDGGVVAQRLDGP